MMIRLVLAMLLLKCFPLHAQSEFNRVLRWVTEDAKKPRTELAEQIKAHVDNLDSTDFATRELATRFLIALDVQTLVSADFVKAYTDPRSLEVEERALRIFKAIVAANTELSRSETAALLHEWLLKRTLDAQPTELSESLSAVAKLFQEAQQRTAKTHSVERSQSKEKDAQYSWALARYFPAHFEISLTEFFPHEPRRWLKAYDSKTEETFYLDLDSTSFQVVPAFNKSQSISFSEKSLEFFKAKHRPNLKNHKVFKDDFAWENIHAAYFSVGMELDGKTLKPMLVRWEKKDDEYRLTLGRRKHIETWLDRPFSLRDRD